jgi:hypothetical protein
MLFLHGGTKCPCRVLQGTPERSVPASSNIEIRLAYGGQHDGPPNSSMPQWGELFTPAAEGVLLSCEPCFRAIHEDRRGLPLGDRSAVREDRASIDWKEGLQPSILSAGLLTSSNASETAGDGMNYAPKASFPPYVGHDFPFAAAHLDPGISTDNVMARSRRRSQVGLRPDAES